MRLNFSSGLMPDASNPGEAYLPIHTRIAMSHNNAPKQPPPPLRPNCLAWTNRRINGALRRKKTRLTHPTGLPC